MLSGLLDLEPATANPPQLVYKLVFERSSIRDQVSSPSLQYCVSGSLCHLVPNSPTSITMDQNLAAQISSLEHGPTDGEVSTAGLARSTALLQTARSVIATADRSPSVRSQLGSPRWLTLVGILQKLAYDDPDTGGETDIALWCERQWATQLQNEPDNKSALQGTAFLHLLCARLNTT